jgi:hypothetical protein
MRRPQLRDQNVLIPSIGGTKCRAGHFWSHDLVELMLWSPSFGDENDAKATAAGSDCFDPQHWGIKVSSRPLWIPWTCGSNALIPTIRGSKWREGHSCWIRMFWSPTLGDLLWNLIGNRSLWNLWLHVYIYIYCVFWSLNLWAHASIQ